MPTSSPATRPTGYGTFVRTLITLVMAVIAVLAFAFSFGNVWTLALRLGVPRPVAPLIAPMVDLSVVGLLVALHHLVATGTDPRRLRPATRLMHLCGLLTLALNTAEPVLAAHYGRAVLDTVAPVLLLGWGVVGPDLLHLLHTPPTVTGTGRPTAAGPGQHPVLADTVDTAVEDEPLAAEPEPVVDSEPTVEPRRTGRRPAASLDDLAEIARPAVEEHGPTHTVIRTALREAGMSASNDRVGLLLRQFKNEQTDTDQPQPTAA
ncbi:DUF2637 domain-containing protein [Kitasatospora griseola]|uniref:DUF2637 domain-containing protein n=1 Tax=Kitasatospora griseola TaxID=2064 RepID=UPI00342E133A